MKKMDFNIGFIVGVLIYALGYKIYEINSDKKWKERAKVFRAINTKEIK